MDMVMDKSRAERSAGSPLTTQHNATPTRLGFTWHVAARRYF